MSSLFRSFSSPDDNSCAEITTIRITFVSLHTTKLRYTELPSQHYLTTLRVLYMQPALLPSSCYRHSKRPSSFSFSVCPARVFCNALASYQPSRHRKNYPYFSTCSQAITGRAFAQEDSGCVFIEHDCLLNIVLVAKSDVIITQLAPNT